jgi:hypothetical protein
MYQAAEANRAVARRIVVERWPEALEFLDQFETLGTGAHAASHRLNWSKRVELVSLGLNLQEQRELRPPEPSARPRRKPAKDSFLIKPPPRLCAPRRQSLLRLPGSAAGRFLDLFPVWQLEATD